MDVVGVGIFVATAIAVYPRIFYGIDFTDDAFYVALPYGFVLGHRPIADELGAHQFAALPLLPLFQAYVGWVGSNAGLVLFARHLYFAASLGAALVARSTLSAAFGSRAGSFAGALALAYIPFLMPTLGYNSMACLSMLAGTLLLASACLPEASPSRLVWGTLCVALASFAYPPVFVGAAAALGLTLAAFWRVREPEARPRALAAVLVSGVAAALAAVLVFFRYGRTADLRRLSDINEALAYQGGGVEKLLQLWQEMSLQAPYLAVSVITLGAMLACMRRVPDARLAAALAVMTGPALVAIEAVYRPYREPFTTAAFVVSVLGLLAPFVLWIVRDRVGRHARAGLGMVVVAAWVGTAIVLWATANGLRNGALGMLPASIVTLACAGSLRSREAARGSAFVGDGLVYTLFVVSLLGFQVSQIWTHMYRDHPPSMLDARVERGAWKGVRTTVGKKAFVETFIADLETYRGDAQSVLFMDYFPGGYLLSDLRPRTPALYLLPWNDAQQGSQAGREVYARELGDEDAFPDLLVRIKCIPVQGRVVPIPQRGDDPLALRLRTGDYALVGSRDCYNIWKRAGVGAY